MIASGSVARKSLLLIDRLVKAMDIWAHDEDGVHPGAWDAYKEASAVLCRPVKDDIE
jgi:hypothetical protein